MAYRTPVEVQKRKNENQQKIMETALKIFAERGYHATTVKDVVDAAEMSVGSFYFYFKNKEDLLEQLCAQMVPMVRDVIEKEVSPGSLGVVENLCNSVALPLAFFQEKRDLAKLLFIEAIGIAPGLEEKNAEAFRTLVAILEKRLSEFSKQGIIRVEDIKLTAMALYGEVYFTVINWLYGNTDSNLIDYAYPLVSHQLRALSIEFEEKMVMEFIDNLLSMKSCKCHS